MAVVPDHSGQQPTTGAPNPHARSIDGEGTTNVRYLVFFMMFVAILINYMDRANFTVSVPLIEKQFGFDIGQMGQIAFIWGLAYALFNFPGGWFADKLGIRKAASFALGFWSIFTILSAVAYSLVSWCVIRGLMGVGEAPIWPINAKTTSTWSAPSERARAFTLAGSGQFVGSAFGVYVSGLIVHWFGWQWTFIIFGALGLLWVPIWMVLVRDTPQSHPWISQRELRFIQGVSGARPLHKREHHLSRDEMKNAISAMLTRNGVGVLLTFLSFGYVLFTFLNWLPDYMYETFQLTIVKSASWTSITYAAGFVGYLVSGPVNDALVARYGHAKGRKLGAGVPMAIMAVIMLIALETSKRNLVAPTAALIAVALFSMNVTVGAWTINAVDLAPTPTSSAFVYGICNGILNLMGTFSNIIVTWIAKYHGFIWAFSSAVVFMAVFLIGLIVVIDRNGIVPAREVPLEVG
ncbi:MAG TPA: MFS transporter [Lacipirellulaceae bacterium]|nr:MFS transporter [Lacipirellulaceae bacterium]